jgi:hypothetical protein
VNPYSHRTGIIERRSAYDSDPFSFRDREDAFAAVIRCTGDPAKADKRTRSKWSRVMRYAAAHKPDSECLDQFTSRKGGINACAARFTRLGQRAGP